MRGDAWRIPSRADVAGPLFDNLRMRGVKADRASSHQTGDDRQGSAASPVFETIALVARLRQ
jgi:hypothetical protein